MRTFMIFAVMASGMIMAVGCQGPVEPAKPKQNAAPSVADLGTTISDLCEFSGYQTVRVQGYGLVWNLADTGSSECPPSQLQAMLTYLRQIRPQRYMPSPYREMSAETLLNSRKTAVVQVTGLIGPGSPKGTIFNVDVTVAPATQTTSLIGGYLIETDLRMTMRNPLGRSLDSRIVAVAEGPVFINPFPLSDAAEDGTTNTLKADPRSGVILGGGKSLHDRRVQLDIIEPDYRIAAQLERRINGRFMEQEGKKIADANRSRLLITLPGRYRQNPQDFYGMLGVMYLQDRTGYLELKLRELETMARQDDADLEQIALAWRAIGRTSIQYLRQLYSSDDNEALRFYAAKTALQLGDTKAVEALGRIATDDASVWQNNAAAALGLAGDDIQARALLGQLLNHPNNKIRLIAYEQLRNTLDARIKVAAMPGGFQIEAAPGDQENLLCVWATNVGRIVFIGKDLRLEGPLFYESEATGVILDFPAGSDLVNISGTDALTGELLMMTSPPGLKDIIAAMAMPTKNSGMGNHHGLGLSFSEIVGILYELCRPQVRGINATFILHRREGDLMD